MGDEYYYFPASGTIGPLYYGSPGFYTPGFYISDNSPDIWRCAYCNCLQANIKDVIIRSYKIQERVIKCSNCNAPRTEKQ